MHEPNNGSKLNGTGSNIMKLHCASINGYKIQEIIHPLRSA